MEEFTTVSFKVSSGLKKYLQEKGNVSAYLRGLVEAERVGGTWENNCPFCDYLRKWGRGKKRGV